MPRLLCLDGGGTWSLIQARTLGRLYGDETPGTAILAEFDLVAATSGGSIVAAALAEDYTPREIARLFLDANKRRSLFVPRGPRFLPHRWRSAGKLTDLLELLPRTGRTRLDELPEKLLSLHPHLTGVPRFLFTGFDYDRRRVAFFRSDGTSPAASGSLQQPWLAEAVHASSNTPVIYFDAAAEFTASKTKPGNRYWDGAVAGFNNPVMAAVVEAMACPEFDRTFQILSLGTGNVHLPLAPEPQRGRKLRNTLYRSIEPGSLWREERTLVASILDDPPDHASFMAHVVAGGALPEAFDPQPVSRGPIVRMNPLVQPRKALGFPKGEWVSPLIAPPRHERFRTRNEPEELFAAIAGLDMDATSEDDVALIDTFCTAWFANEVTNQPIRAGRDLDLQIGQHSFYDAWTAWYELAGKHPRTLLRVPPWPFPQPGTALPGDTVQDFSSRMVAARLT